MHKCKCKSNLSNLLSLATPDVYKDRGELNGKAGVRKACRFYRDWLGKCSGLGDKEYGFKDGKPCIIVKLNRIVNFRPKVRKQLQYPHATSSRHRV